MRINRVLLVVVIVLLLSGWVLFQVTQTDDAIAPGEPGFRDWFWEQRGLDLVVQVALVFAGALGIAAILPIEENDE